MICILLIMLAMVVTFIVLTSKREQNRKIGGGDDEDMKEDEQDILDEEQKSFIYQNTGLIYQKIIGKGNEGYVFLFTDKEGKQFAIKTYNDQIDEIPNDEDAYNILKQFDYSVKLYSHLQNEEGDHFFVFEYANLGTLLEYVSSLNNKQKELKQIIIKLLKGLKDIHQQQLYHSDIKPENILVAQRNGQQDVSFLYSDFGMSQKITFDSSNNIIKIKAVGFTDDFAPPEVIKKMRHDPTKADIYALGKTIQLMLYQVYKTKSKFPILYTYLLNNMINKQPEQRLTIDKLIALLS